MMSSLSRVDVAPQPRSPQAGETTGGLLQVEAEGERAAEGGQKRLHQVRPEDRRTNLGRLAGDAGHKAEALFCAFDL